MVRDSGHRNTDSEKLDELTPLLEDYARRCTCAQAALGTTL